MKFLVTLTVVLSAVTAQADPPKKQPLSRYAQLWTQSIITTKPPPEEVVTVNALDDWTLAGVVNDPTGPVVMMMKKNDRTERLRIQPGGNAQGYEVVEVKSGSGAGDTVVVMRYRGQVGELRFDDKLTSLQNAPRPAGPAPNPNQRKPAANRTPAPPVPGLPQAATGGNAAASGVQKPRKRVRIVRPRSKK